MLIETLKKRALYHRTINEIRDLPADIADDLGIARADAAKIARRAVYGS